MTIASPCLCDQGFTDKGNPGADAVSTAIAAEVKAGATLVLLNGDICYAECAFFLKLGVDGKTCSLATSWRGGEHISLLLSMQ